MQLKERTESFLYLGEILRSFTGNGKETREPSGKQECIDILKEAVDRSIIENGWFTRNHVLSAIHSISEMLTEPKLRFWLDPYQQNLGRTGTGKTVAVIMAGNIPMVGFHDFLCVLISGNRFLGKLSSGDLFLLPAISKILAKHNHQWENMITFTQERIEKFDAVIATGNNNSGNYFEYYFSGYPHIIRKNRNSVAILSGAESVQDLSLLARDIFLYFGMGCRNVSKIFVPEGYNFTLLNEVLSGYEDLLNHHKYRNNFNYHKAIFDLNNIDYQNAGNILIKKDPEISSPVSVLHYENFSDWNLLETELAEKKEFLQCVVSRMEFPFLWVQPGSTQKPEPWDYADGVDTMRFLTGKTE